MLNAVDEVKNTLLHDQQSFKLASRCAYVVLIQIMLEKY